MNKNSYPHVMTFKELIIYIIVVIIIGFVLVVVRDDYSGILGACIVCPAMIGYLIYAYNKEKKADKKAVQVSRSIVDGDYFNSAEWHAKYVEYINQHPFEKPVIMNMKKDLLKRFRRREYIFFSIIFLLFMLGCGCTIAIGKVLIGIVGMLMFAGLSVYEFLMFTGMPVRRWLKKDIDYKALENSYLESRMLTYKKNGIAFGTTHIHAFTEKKIYAIDYRIVDEITRKVVRLKTYEDGIYSSDEYKHYVVIHVVMAGTSDACDVEIELNEYQVQMVLDNYPTFRIGSNVNDSTVVTEAKEEVTVV